MHTLRLNDKQIGQAADILRRGGLLGIPTETVYGLGANGLNSEAVAHIFAAKGRPQDNPLILHIPTADWLERYCEDIPQAAYALARRFWPGPLTMILKHKSIVPAAVTAGLDTVGMRCPAHPVCRAIIAAADLPVAAPSGNTSGRPSPTNMADMLEDMDGKIDGIVDGGPCSVGVESTIIDLTEQPPPAAASRRHHPGAAGERAGRGGGGPGGDPAHGGGGAAQGPRHEVPPLRPQGAGDGGSGRAGDGGPVHPDPYGPRRRGDLL